VVVLIFSGPLAPFLPQAISYVLIGNALLVATVTVFSSYGGSMAVAQDTPGVILAVAAASVAGSLAKLARWLPALLLGMAMLTAVRRSGKPTVLATLFGLGLLTFYG
jgi:hypothetical protein